MSTSPNPLQELAEKLRDEMFSRHMGSIDVCHRVADAFLPILTASVGTLLQAERAATLANAAQSIRSTIFYREIDVLETRPFYLRDQIADCVEKQLPHPADASALAAVVQRETEKLREHLLWALKKGMYVTLTARNERCDHCPGVRARMDWRSTAAEESKWMADVSWHKPDCPYAVARAALQ